MSSINFEYSHNLEKQKAFFIDKDGTLVDNSNYPHEIPTDKLLTNDIITGLKLISEKGYKIFIVSNQSWIAKGKLQFSDVERIFQNLIRQLNKFNITIENYAYCPHTRTDNCQCRKPNAKLLEDLIRKHNIDIDNSFVIGDMDSDIELGKKLGIKTILVKTGRGKDFLHTNPNHIIENINDIWRILNE